MPPPDPEPSVRTPPQSLAEAVRGWPESRLSALLAGRPDLAVPAPRDSAQVAARAVTRSSMASALDGLDHLELLVLRALVRGDGVAADDLARHLGVDPPRVTMALDRLAALALVWTGPRGPRPVGGLAGLVLAPTGLGPPAIQHDLPVVGPPPLVTADRDPVQVDRVAAGAAFDAVRRTGLLLDHWEASPPPMLRQGGLGLRALRTTAKALDADEATAALLVETAAEAGLVGIGNQRDGGPAWLPTDASDAWSHASAEVRWQRLVEAWLRADRAPALVGSPMRGSGKPVPPLDPGLIAPFLPETRRMSLESLARLPLGVALDPGAGPASLVAALAWLRPRRPAFRSHQVAWTLAEAAVLGLTGQGAVGSPGRALLVGDPAAALSALAGLLPRPVGHVLIQADLTAVAPGPLTPELGDRLQTLADVESRGGATVYRFSAASLRRGLDAGWTAADLHAFLQEVSRTPVPQPLTYLVDDTARRFGVLRVGYAEAFLRTDDEAALSELLAHPGASSLGLRRLAPGVATSGVPLDELLAALRSIGFAPAVEDGDGTLRFVRPDRLRARTPPVTTPPSAAFELGPERLRRAVASVRAGDRAAASRPAPTPVATSPGGVLAVLYAALAAEETVWIGYVDQDGARSERLVEPHEILGGRLTAYDIQREETRVFAIHRIATVRKVSRDGGSVAG